MRVYIASDHGGYELKEYLKSYLSKKGYEVIDVGNRINDPNDDYPDFVYPLAKQISTGEKDETGIVIGRSGNGEQIAANKVKGVRAALCLTEPMAKKARGHNNANILSLGSDYIKKDEAERIVDVFLSTPFSDEERHARRLAKIAEYEDQHWG